MNGLKVVQPFGAGILKGKKQSRHQELATFCFLAVLQIPVNDCCQDKDVISMITENMLLDVFFSKINL